MTSSDVLGVIQNAQIQFRIKLAFMNGAVNILGGAPTESQLKVCSKIINGRLSAEVMTLAIMGDATIMAEDSFDTVTDEMIMNRVGGIMTNFSKVD